MKRYISYKDDDENETIKRGYFEVVDESNPNFIKIKTDSGNILSIPHHRILKQKESSK